MNRRAGAALGLMTAIAVLVSACSGGLSLDEYARQVDELVRTMNRRLDAAIEAQPSPPTLDDVRAVWAERSDARWDFLEAIAELDPPASVADLHEAAIDLITELAEAETAMADLAARAEDLDELVELAAGPAARFEEIDARAVAFCRATQETFDATEMGESLADVPFIPNEMKQVVSVAFQCTLAERQDG